METDHLKEFVHLADSLSFKKTADHFYVSRSVISRHLAALEESFGVKLIERDSRAIRLTRAGKEFYREAQIVLRDCDNMAERMQALQEGEASVVRIGYLRNAARPVIVRFVRFMEVRHPDVRLSLSCMEYGDLRRAMEEGTVDAAIAVNVSPAQSRNYRTIQLYTDEFYAVMSKSHPLASREGAIALDDLPNEKLLLPDSYVYSGLSQQIDRFANQESRAIARAYYSDVDMLYLKVQTEGYVAFSSGLNNSMFGDRLAVRPVDGIESGFTVSAFIQNHFPEALYEKCREGFEACRDELAALCGMEGSNPAGISLEHLG